MLMTSPHRHNPTSFRRDTHRSSRRKEALIIVAPAAPVKMEPPHVGCDTGREAVPQGGTAPHPPGARLPSSPINLDLLTSKRRKSGARKIGNTKGSPSPRPSPPG